MTEIYAPKNHITLAKDPMTAIPLDMLRKYLLPAYQEGFILYERESWRRGFKTSVMVEAILRHTERFFYHNENLDPDSLKVGIEKHHLAGVIFSSISALHSLENYPELDDRFDPATGHPINKKE